MDKLLLSESKGGLLVRSHMMPMFLWQDPEKYTGPGCKGGLLRGPVLLRVRNVLLVSFVFVH